MRIVYFAPIYYDDLMQRPQQIALQLARHHQVVYVEPTVCAMKYWLKGGKNFRGGKRKENNQLHIIRMNGFCTIHKSLEFFDFFGLNSISEYFQIRKIVRRADILWVGYAGWYTLVRHFMKKPIVYDKMDREDLLRGNIFLKFTIRRNVKSLERCARAVFLTSRKLRDKSLVRHDNVYVVPNAVSEDFIPKENEGKIYFGKISKIQKIGYVGTIADWFDFDVIYELLKMEEKYEIFLIGNNFSPYMRHERLHYSKARPHSELASCLFEFDLCLYNFKKGSLLDTINPVKLYEYLSANKPVLAVRSPETERFQKYLRLYDYPSEVPQIIRKDWQTPFENEKQRQRFVRRNSWESRGRRVECVLHRVVLCEDGLQ